MAGRMINGATALAELVRSGNEAGEGGAQRALPVLPALGGLLPGRGLRRGSTVAVGAVLGGLPGRERWSEPGRERWSEPGRGWRSEPGRERSSEVEQAGRAEPGRERQAGAGRERQAGAGREAWQRPGAAFRPEGQLRAPVAVGNTSLLLALLAAASEAGSWCAVVGVPELGAVAAAESGIALERLALVPNPGPEWPTVVGALIDGVDVVVLAVPGPVAPTVASRLVARARQRGCVLVPYGRWDGADVNLQVVRGQWEGLGEGHGRLRRRTVTVVARGRGAAARPKELTLWMPAAAPRPAIPPVPQDVVAPASGEEVTRTPVEDLAGATWGKASVEDLAGATPVAASGTVVGAAASWEALRGKVRLATVDGETVDPA